MAAKEATPHIVWSKKSYMVAIESTERSPSKKTVSIKWRVLAVVPAATQVLGLLPEAVETTFKVWIIKSSVAYGKFGL